MIIEITLMVEVEGDYKRGKEAVRPHAGNPDGTPPESPEVKITSIMLPAESSKQVDILEYIDASTLVEVEDDFQALSEQEQDDG